MRRLPIPHFLFLAICTLTGQVIAEQGAAANRDRIEAAHDTFVPHEEMADAEVSVGGKIVKYHSAAGTLVVRPRDTGTSRPGEVEQPSTDAEASIFYVAYFRSGERPEQRPVTFFFNGGPGSSTIWLHMGAFGPRRVRLGDEPAHVQPAPYSIVNNEFSLLDVSDLVFIDAPGTGYSRIRGPNGPKSFYGVDPDGWAFSDFIVQFLSKYRLWNSPKYLFGESYGTTRAAVVANVLESERNVELNGIVLLAQILNFDGRSYQEQFNPGVDLPYQLALPTYAATAWYHHRLPQERPDLQAFLREVERFSLTEYGAALQAGAGIDREQRESIVRRLHQYTGLETGLIDRADLRITEAVFRQSLLQATGATIGRLDTRFTGPTLDPVASSADYDPYEASTQAAFVAAFQQYMARDAHYAATADYKALADFDSVWNFAHQAPGATMPLPRATNVMPDLACAMKYNPKLRVLVNLGYFDLATPYFEGIYEIAHLAVPANIRSNVSFRVYESGHMVYANPAALKDLHQSVARFMLDGATAAK